MYWYLVEVNYILMPYKFLTFCYNKVYCKFANFHALKECMNAELFSVKRV